MEDANNADQTNEAIGNNGNIDAPNPPPADAPAPAGDGQAPGQKTGADVVSDAQRQAGDMQSSRDGGAPDAA